MSEINGTAPELPPINTREQLVAALREAAEIEHLFICQYLYSAFSLKKDPDGECTPAELESVRRWASQLYMIARQEMEHLSFVLSMLSAIGEWPHLDRPNIPIQYPQFLGDSLKWRHGPGADVPQPCDLPFLLERFCLRSVRRYTCMESPRLDEVPEPERDTVRHWCFADDRDGCGCVAASSDGVEVHRPHDLATAAVVAVGPEGLIIGDIERYYDRIALGFKHLSAGPEPLFTGAPSRQVEILSEYNIFLFPVTDLGSALAAVDLITRQGEGLKGPPGFDSHFRNFYETAREIAELEESAKSWGRRFDPSHPVPLNPRQNDFTNPLALQILKLFNFSYATLLDMLTGLYGHFQPPEQESYPHISAALQETVFAPAMTMLIRPLGELLVQLPLANGPERAAPDFFVDCTDRELLADPGNPCFADIGFYLNRMEEIDARIGVILESPSAHAADESIQTRLRYIQQNVYRLAGNLRQIYQSGVYVKFRTTP